MHAKYSGKGQGRDGSHRGRSKDKSEYGASARVDQSDSRSFGMDGDGKNWGTKKTQSKY